jgi:cyanophycinase
VFIPTALDDPIPAEPDELKLLRRAGAKEVKVLHPRTPGEVDSPPFLAALRQARGVWFAGGREWRLIDAYQDTAADKLFHDVLRRGGVIGGSSAGAAVQGDYLVRGDSRGNARVLTEGYERGLGFLRGVAIDEHFFRRNHREDMSELLEVYPQLLGLGIDEQAAVVVHGDMLEVIGRGRVAVYDRSRPVAAGRPDHEQLTTGDHYNLRRRQELAARRSGQ